MHNVLFHCKCAQGPMKESEVCNSTVKSRDNNWRTDMYSTSIDNDKTFGIPPFCPRIDAT